MSKKKKLDYLTIILHHVINKEPLSRRRVGPSSSPHLQYREGRFLGRPVRISSPPANRQIPRPPAAASAAGGRGILGSRCVCRLGVRGCVLAGAGVVEAVVPERLLLAMVFPSDGAAPVELRRGSAVAPWFAALRSARQGFPVAGGREMADPAFVDL